MKVRYIKNKEITGSASKLNGIGEVIVQFDDGSADSEFASELEIFISKNLEFLITKGIIPEWKSVGHWIPLSKSFKEHLVITDNHNTEFFEPENEEEKKRGYRL